MVLKKFCDDCGKELGENETQGKIFWELCEINNYEHEQNDYCMICFNKRIDKIKRWLKTDALNEAVWENGYLAGLKTVLEIVIKHKGHGECINKILDEIKKELIEVQKWAIWLRC